MWTFACCPAEYARRAGRSHGGGVHGAPVLLPSEVVHASDPATGAFTVRDVGGTGKPHVTGAVAEAPPTGG